MSVYAPQLATITDKLKAYAAKTGAKLLFGITSPMMANARADQVRRQPQPDAPNARVNVRAWVRAGRGGVESSCGGGHGRGQRADGRSARRGGGEVWPRAPESVRPLSSSPSPRLVGVSARVAVVRRCLGMANCFSPHCGNPGYEWIAKSTVVPALEKLLGDK